MILDDRGRNGGVGEDGLYQQLARQGTLVCAADVRGIGDTRPEVGRGNPGYTIEHDSEEDFAWGSLILGKSLLKQRAEDILALVQALKNDARVSDRRLVVAARGRLAMPVPAGVPCVYACRRALSGRRSRFVRESAGTRGIPAAHGKFPKWEMLAKADLPQIAAKAARTIHLAGTVDAQGNKMDISAVRRIYSSANVTVSPEARDGTRAHWEPCNVQSKEGASMSDNISRRKVIAAAALPS